MFDVHIEEQRLRVTQREGLIRFLYIDLTKSNNNNSNNNHNIIINNDNNMLLLIGALSPVNHKGLYQG